MTAQHSTAQHSTAQHSSDETPLSDREQQLLAHIRKAQIAAVLGDIPGMLDAQAKIYNVLISLIGDQTQQVLQIAYGR